MATDPNNRSFLAGEQAARERDNRFVMRKNLDAILEHGRASIEFANGFFGPIVTCHYRGDGQRLYDAATALNGQLLVAFVIRGVYSDSERPHFARQHLPPDFQAPESLSASLHANDIICNTRLGGLLRS